MLCLTRTGILVATALFTFSHSASAALVAGDVHDGDEVTYSCSAKTFENQVSSQVELVRPFSRYLHSRLGGKFHFEIILGAFPGEASSLNLQITNNETGEVAKAKTPTGESELTASLAAGQRAEINCVKVD